MSLEIGTATDHADLFAKLRAFLVAGENASQTLTFAGNGADAETVTIGAKTYTLQSSLTDSDGNVQLGANAEETIDNLVAAINLDDGAGTKYATSMTVHPTARAVKGSATTLVARAKTPGSGGNALATTETLSNGSWGAATMAGGGASAWTELDYNGIDNTAIYEAPGLSGTEEIHVGFGYVENPGTDAYALTGWMFRSYNALLAHQSQPGHSGLGYHPVWNTSIPYWFIANGQRVIIVTKISTVYTASYLGKILPYGVPGEWPQCYYLGMPTSSNSRWSSISENFRNFWDPGNTGGSRMLNPDGNWYNVNNFQDLGGGEINSDGTNYIWPYQAQFGTVESARTRWREIRDNVDGSRTLVPCILCGENPSTDIWGELDGTFACSGFNAASEDLIVQGGEKHLLVQNIFRTTHYYYAAIKMV